MGMKEQTTARDPVASSLWGGDCIVGFSVSAVTGDPERISQPGFSRWTGASDRGWQVGVASLSPAVHVDCDKPLPVPFASVTSKGQVRNHEKLLVSLTLQLSYMLQCPTGLLHDDLSPSQLANILGACSGDIRKILDILEMESCTLIKVLTPLAPQHVSFLHPNPRDTPLAFHQYSNILSSLNSWPR